MAARRKKSSRRPLTAKQQANLAKGRVKKGEVRNPKGANGWTKARERVRELMAEHAEDLTTVMVKLAKKGDVQALRFLLGPMAPVVQQQIEHTGGITFEWAGDRRGTAAKARKANGDASEADQPRQ